MAPIELRQTKLLLNLGFGEIPALGFGTLIPDATALQVAVGTALETGFRHFNCAERYHNEDAVGDPCIPCVGPSCRSPPCLALEVLRQSHTSHSLTRRVRLRRSFDEMPSLPSLAWRRPLC